MKRFFSLQLIVALLLLQPAAAHLLVVPAPAAAPEPSAAVVRRSVDEFRSLSKQEQKLRIKEAKKEAKALRKSGSDERTILLVILAILLPPLAVYLHQQEINTKFWISLILTLLFWVPGVIYSLLVVLGVV